MKDNTKIIQKARRIISDTAETIAEELDDLMVQEQTYALETVTAAAPERSERQRSTKRQAFPSMD
jgi:hypothetical protein